MNTSIRKAFASIGHVAMSKLFRFGRVAAMLVAMIALTAGATPVGIYVDGIQLDDDGSQMSSTNEDEYGWRFTVSKKLYIVGGTHEILGAINDQDFIISVDGGCSITISNLLVKSSAPFRISENVNAVNLTLAGENYLESIDGLSPGLHLCGNTHLAIDALGKGSLTAIGQSGIGGWRNVDDPTLTINSGKITAKAMADQGNSCGSAIGGMKTHNRGQIIINGGTIRAEGTGRNKAGIGCRESGSVTINGGTVTAIGGGEGAGIGTGSEETCGTVTINGGWVYAKGGTEFTNLAGAGIGGGMFSDGGCVEINGGTVWASSGAPINGYYPTDDIGAGGSGENSGTLLITGGSVYLDNGKSAVPRNAPDSGGLELSCLVVSGVPSDNSTVTVAGLSELPDNGYSYGVNDLYPLIGKLYLWLPESFEVGGAEVDGQSVTILPPRPRAKAVLKYVQGEPELRFVCDSTDYDAAGATWYSIEDAEKSGDTVMPWRTVCETQVKRIEIEASFRQYKPRNCAGWFAECSAVTNIAGLGNIDVSSVTNMSCMFYDCSKVKTLELSGFRTTNVRYMSNMFSGCGDLETIYASQLFSLAALEEGGGLTPFTGCDKLVGGAGNQYQSENNSIVFARIDSANTPGYFTLFSVAVWDASTRTLVFYCDSQDHSDEGPCYIVADAEKLNSGVPGLPAWVVHSNVCEHVIFDSSFGSYYPTQCLRWFSGMTALKSVTGTEYLSMDNARSLEMMFYGCSSLKELNLTGNDTGTVTNMWWMFAGCSSLETIYVSGGFTTGLLSQTDNQMFRDCTSLVGGNGTGYSVLRTSADYACIDNDDHPGYFSSTPVAKAVYVTGGELRFYCDSKDHSNEGTVYTMLSMMSNSARGNLSNYVTKVVFAPSFANYHPESCRRWFKDFCDLSTVVGMSYLDVSHAQDLSGMFSGCSALTTLDLSHFETIGVTDMTDMFAGCSGLTTIYASNSFRTDSLVDRPSLFEPPVPAVDQSMFSDCTSLVGGAGFAYDAAKTGHAYACIGTESREGYFTEPGPVAVAVYSADSHTLTFYYDMLEHADEGDVYPLSQLSESTTQAWYGHRTDINEVVFDPSFAEYRIPTCNNLFNGFSNLATITGFQYFDVSEATSMRRMFAYCGSLTVLNLVHFDTSSVTSMADMFASCGALTTIYASGSFTTASLVNPPQNVFSGCTSLVGGAGTAFSTEDSAQGRNRVSTYARVDRPGSGAPGYFTEANLAAVAVVSTDGTTLAFYYDGIDHTSEGTVYPIAVAEAQNPAVAPPWYDYDGCTTVTNIVIDRLFANYKPQHCGNWFYGFSGVKEIHGLEYIDVSDATSLNSMFSGCTSLASLDVSSFNTANVNSMGSMFYRCSALTVLDVSSFDTSSVTDMGSMFAYATSLTVLDLNGFDTSAVTDMSSMFTRCDNLVTIYASDGFTTSGLASPCSMFFLCNSLVGGNGTQYEYDNDSSLFAQIDTPMTPGYFTRKKLPKAVVSTDGKTLTFYYDALVHEGEGTVFEVPAAETRNPDADAPWLVLAQSTVINAVFDASFADYRPRYCGFWFYNMQHLQGIQGIENLNVSGATSLRLMFSRCSSLEELDLSAFDTRNVTDMVFMFSGCTSLTTIYASGKFRTTALTDLDEDVFGDCTLLRGDAGMVYDAALISARYARLDSDSNHGYFSSNGGTQDSGYAAWAAEKGLLGDDAAWDAKPAMWGGNWANAFIYTYGEGLADGTLCLMGIRIGVDGKAIVTTAPVVDGHDDFTESVVGTEDLLDWTTPVILENNTANDWTLKNGDEANFFKVRLEE